MPRPPRCQPDHVPQHIVNRGNRRAQIFHCTEDYLGFLAAMADAAERTVVRVVGYCLMPNHWHLLLWPMKGSEISAYMQVLMNAHLRDLLKRHDLAGKGHVYQGRYRSRLILNDAHFLNACRYVEANAREANLCLRAEDWPWSSLACTGPAEDINLLSQWPFPRPDNWLDLVNITGASEQLLEPPAAEWWQPR